MARAAPIRRRHPTTRSRRSEATRRSGGNRAEPGSAFRPSRNPAAGGSRAVLSLDRLFDEPCPKIFRQGTHRINAPSETLARVRPQMAAMGITRLGNITGLDRIGIPVAIAVRPKSRSVSVSQGKGLDLPQAMASALMEACEGFHAEEIGLCRRASYRALAACEAVVEPNTLPAGLQPFDPEASLAWIRGHDLLQREPCWVPAEHRTHGLYAVGARRVFPRGIERAGLRKSSG